MTPPQVAKRLRSFTARESAALDHVRRVEGSQCRDNARQTPKVGNCRGCAWLSSSKTRRHKKTGRTQPQTAEEAGRRDQVLLGGPRSLPPAIATAVGAVPGLLENAVYAQCETAVRAADAQAGCCGPESLTYLGTVASRGRSVTLVACCSSCLPFACSPWSRPPFVRRCYSTTDSHATVPRQADHPIVEDVRKILGST